MDEPKPFSAEFNRLYAEYLGDGAPGSWQAWLATYENRPHSAHARTPALVCGCCVDNDCECEGENLRPYEPVRDGHPGDINDPERWPDD